MVAPQFLFVEVDNKNQVAEYLLMIIFFLLYPVHRLTPFNRVVFIQTYIELLGRIIVTAVFQNFLSTST